MEEKYLISNCLITFFLVYLHKQNTYKMRNSYTAIACINGKNAIANEGKLMYHIKADLENFRSLTIGNVVILGRRTFESLPNSRPLPGRINIIVTRNTDYTPEGVENWSQEDINNTFIVNSLQEADDLCYSYFSDRELFIIGGGIVYSEAFKLNMVDKVILTVVNDDADGDVFFPDMSQNESFKVIFKTTSLRDHPNDTYYKYVVYKRK